MFILLLVILILSSLFDFYFKGAGGRVFDYIAILPFLYITRDLVKENFLKLQLFVKSNTRTALFILIFLTYLTIMGLFNVSSITHIGILFGFFILLPGSKVFLPKITVYVNFLVILHLSFFFLQFITYKTSGHILDFHTWVGSISPRVFNPSIEQFRAAGLFQEPNSYCVYAFLLFALRYFYNNKIQIWDYLIFLTLFLSESLWGMALALVLPVLFEESKKRKFAFGFGSVIFAYLISIQSPYLTAIIHPTTINRLANLHNDPSAQQRYFLNEITTRDPLLPVQHEAGSTQFTTDTLTAQTLISKLQSSWYLIFGHGVDRYKFNLLMGSNGVGYFVYNFGILGCLILLYLYLKNVSERPFAKFIVICVSLSSFPLVTTAFWWIWVGLIMMMRAEKIEKV